MSLGASTPFVVVAVATWGVRAMVECNVTVVMINYKGVAVSECVSLAALMHVHILFW